MSGDRLMLLADPVIPDYGTATACVRHNGTFCASWFVQQWPSVFGPALVQHIELTAIAVVIGFVLAFAAALVAHRHRWTAPAFGGFAAVVYTIPPLALFELLVPLTGLSTLTVEIALVAYTLLVLFRNILTGLQEVPADIHRAGVGMGLTRRQMLLRVELPMALPAIIGGLRVVTVLTISVVTVAAFVVDAGLGAPILKALQSPFNTQFIAAGGLAVLLALVADAGWALLGRLLTPWARTRRLL
ncbi:MAG: ABC transporter permease [Actinocatenispora sp.]